MYRPIHPTQQIKVTTMSFVVFIITLWLITSTGLYVALFHAQQKPAQPTWVRILMVIGGPLTVMLFAVDMMATMI